MDNIFVYHHLGLGDHIICHALVRHLYAQAPADANINLFCKPHNHASVAFMYKDLNRLQIIKADDARARKLIPCFSTGVIIGHENYRPVPGKTFDETFFEQLSIPFSERWNSFHVARDLQREQDLFRRLDVKDKYAFVHDDPSRNLIIDRKHINSELRIVTPYDVKTDNIFDYMTIMEHAEEVHCMDSSFRLMFDSLSQRTNNVFYHVNLLGGVKRPDISRQRLTWTVV